MPEARPPLQAARLEFDERGVPFASQYGDVYHSADGALEQAHHVFLHGNGLPARWQGHSPFCILETGFGIGLNFIATWRAWQNDPKRCRHLHFVSVEKHPFSQADLSTLHQRLLGAEYATLSHQLIQRWPLATHGIHRLHLQNDALGSVTLTLLFGEVQPMLRQAVLAADAIYLDGFAPARNPDMWSDEVIHALSRLAAPNATFASWSVTASVRRALEAQGFATEKCPGFGHKRDMMHGALNEYGNRVAEQRAARQPRFANQRAVVIGAGLAGCAATERLAARGWNVDLIERHAAPAQEASGNLAGLMRPMLARDESHIVRLSRSAYLYGLAQLNRLNTGLDSPPRFGMTGILQVARDAEHAQEQRDILQRLNLPTALVQFCEGNEASSHCGWPQTHGGWWFPHAAWVNPPSLCTALLAQWPERIRTLFCQSALSVERTARDTWRVLDGEQCIAEAEVVIFANAADACQFGLQLPLEKVRGQVTHIPPTCNALQTLKAPVCGEGYVVPHYGDAACLGATFEFNDDSTEIRPAAHLENLARLQKLLPGVDLPALNQLEGRVSFRTATPDRLPFVGPVPDWQTPLKQGTKLRDVGRQKGLYAAVGYGARGLTWCGLAGEILAAQICGEPLPIELDLLESIDPARYLVRAASKGKNHSV